MARATVLSGSYMLYERHATVPPPEAFAEARLNMPNCSGRMDNLRAAILRPQLERLDDTVARWNERYAAVENALRDTPGLELVARSAKEHFVGSSIQFYLTELDADGIVAFIDRCAARGVELKWFGTPEPHGYTSRHDSWRYLEAQSLPRTDALLAQLCDMRISLAFSVADCDTIGQIISACLAEIGADAAA